MEVSSEPAFLHSPGFMGCMCWWVSSSFRSSWRWHFCGIRKALSALSPCTGILWISFGSSYLPSFTYYLNSRISDQPVCYAYTILTSRHPGTCDLSGNTAARAGCQFAVQLAYAAAYLADAAGSSLNGAGNLTGRFRQKTIDGYVPTD